MRTALVIALLSAVSVLMAAETPKKGDTVYISRAIELRLSSLELRYANIPYKKMNCPGTLECRYSLTWCEPVQLRKQDSEKTVIRPAGLMSHTLAGDFRHATFLDQASCDRAFAEALQSAIPRATPPKQ